MVKIDLISGFLGAGKTTLIQKLIKDALHDTKVVLIENEFGEIGIDGGFLQESGIEIREMNSGCICCSLVGDFKTSLQEVLATYTPERIIIEPSGVGKLSDVITAVEGVGDEVVIAGKVTVVDVNKCKLYLKNFGEFFLNQVEAADTILLSRTGTASAEKVQQAVELLREHNPNAVIVTTPWDQLDGADLLAEIEQHSDMAAELMAEVEHHHEHHHHDHEHCDHDHDHHEHEHEHHHEHGESCSCGHDHSHDHEHEHDHDHHDHEHEHEHHHHEYDENGVCSCGHHHGEEEHEHHHHDHEHCDHDHHEHEHEHHHDHGESCSCGHDHNHDHEHEEGHLHVYDENGVCSCGHHHGEHDHHHHHHADDVFTSWGMETPATYSAAQLEQALKALDQEETYGIVLRAKGMLPGENGNWIYFDYVPEETELRAGKACVTGKICVIGSKLNTAALEQLFKN